MFEIDLPFIGGEVIELPEDAPRFDFWLDYLKKYLDEVEEFLISKASATHERYRDIGAYNVVGDYLEAIEDLFPNILRRSLFVTVLFAAEDELKDTCQVVEKQKGLSLSLNEIRAPGGIIGKVKKYLEKLARISFPSTPEWDELKDLWKLRNCVVHSQGYLTSNRDDYLRSQYIPKCKGYLSVSSDIYGDEVIFHRGFCERVIEIVNICFQQLNSAFMAEKHYGARKLSYGVVEKANGRIEVRVYHRNATMRRRLENSIENPSCLLRRYDAYSHSNISAEKWLSHVMADYTGHFLRNVVDIVLT